MNQIVKTIQRFFEASHKNPSRNAKTCFHWLMLRMLEAFGFLSFLVCQQYLRRVPGFINGLQNIFLLQKVEDKR